jgi:hypothetical protein
VRLRIDRGALVEGSRLGIDLILESASTDVEG